MSCSRVRVLLGTIVVSIVVAPGCGPGATSAGLVGQAAGDAVLNAGADVGDVYLSWDAGTFPDGTQLTARAAAGEVTPPASTSLIAAVRIESTAQPAQPVRLTLSVPEIAQGQSTVFLHSPDGAKWEALLVAGADLTEHTATVLTPSFSIFGVFKRTSSDQPVDTDFADTDTPVEENPLPDKYPLGTCMGMACFTAWYCDNGKSGDIGALCRMSSAAFKENSGIAAKAQDVVDPLLTNLLVALNQWAQINVNLVVNQPDMQHDQLLLALADTQRPQLLVLATNRNPLALRPHALLVTRSEANGDTLMVYNPNDPHSLHVLTWPWDSDELSQDSSNGPSSFYFPVFVPEWFWNPSGEASAQFADILAECKQLNSPPAFRQDALSTNVEVGEAQTYPLPGVSDPDDGAEACEITEVGRGSLPAGITVEKSQRLSVRISVAQGTPAGDYPVTIGVTDNYENPSLTPYRYTVPCELTLNVLSAGDAGAGGGDEQSAVATPTFDPPSGTTFADSVDVAIWTATSGATIRYTTDGSTPSSSHGTVYGGSVHLTATTTVKAIAYKDGMTDSAVGEATFTKVGSGAPAVAGSIVAWGRNEQGQGNVPAPNTGFVAVAARGAHSLGLKADGSIVAWGYNNYGQCNVPAPNTGFVAVAAGGGHSLGLKADGSIMAWGWNVYGQCNVPAPNSGFVGVAGGYWHSLGLKADGSIVAWGYNASEIGRAHV